METTSKSGRKILAETIPYDTGEILPLENSCKNNQM